MKNNRAKKPCRAQDTKEKTDGIETGGSVVPRLELEQSRTKQRAAYEKEKWQSILKTEQAAEKLGNGVTGRERTEERRPTVGIVGSVAERRNTQAKSLAAIEQSERQERQSGENTVRTWEHSCRATDTSIRNREPAFCTGKQSDRQTRNQEQDLKAGTASSRSREKENHPDLDHEGGNTNDTTRKQKKRFFHFNSTRVTTDPRRSPSSLPHLIGTKIKFLAHFYSRKYENGIEKW
jgi:hypothetical protein